MSLILDALRKSAGERQRGQTPTLASAVGLSPRRRAHPARVPVALALLAGTAGAGWWLAVADGPAPATVADRGGAAEPAPGADTAAETTMAEALGSAPTLADSAPALRPEAVQLPVDDLTPQMGEAQSGMAGGTVAGGGGAALPLPPGTVYTPEAMASSAPPAAEPSAGEPAAAPVAPSAAVQPSAMAPAPSMPPISAPAAPGTSAPIAAAASADALPRVDELDYTIRRELPSLDVSMYVYHADPARRFLIIGGKRYPRSDATGARITAIEDKVELVDIRADGAVLEFNGQRFLLPRNR